MKQDFSKLFEIIKDKFILNHGGKDSLPALADFLGHSHKGKVTAWSKGQWPSAQDCWLLHIKMGLDIEWLLTGEGDMLRAGLTPAAHGEDQRVRELEERVRLLQELLDAKDKIIAMYEEKGEGRKSVGIDARTGPPVVRS